VAVIVGTTWGEALELEQSLLVPGAPPREPLSGMSERLRCELGAEGPCCVVTTTCAAGNHAIAIGCDLLRGGCADAALAVGTDALSYTVLLGFSRLLLRDPQTCRPFDLHRNGTVLSEGAGALLLERAPSALRRGAAILGEVAGCGLSCDAAGPFESRAANLASLEVAADAAFRDAGFGPEVIDHVSAHGSATRLNDVKETNFLKRLLGPRAYAVPVSGIKSMLGHAQGAASSLEAIACLLTLRHDVLYPTINLCTPDPDCDLDYVPGAARAARVNAILSNAFGMGGTNALCIFRRWDEP
jgi:3-oxoacyl-(acyl-carrier-protein) synthase